LARRYVIRSGKWPGYTLRNAATGSRQLPVVLYPTSQNMNSIACPNCGTQLAAVPELAGQTVGCRQCGAHFIMPSAELEPPPPPSFRSPSTFSHQTGPLHSDPPRRSFHPRKYPALTAVCITLYRLAAFHVLAFIVETVWMLGAAGMSVYQRNGAAVPGAFLLIVFAFCFHAFCAIMLVAAAELIRVVVDIQQNTERMAFYSR